MIVVSVLYPSGGPLDIDYYRDRHLPLVRRLLEPMGMLSLAYFAPDQPATYQLVAELRFADRKTADAALAAHGAETQADIGNFTAVTPVILLGDEVQA
jgi:uncharacterized protein (TIGR02118 family)